MKIWTRLLAVAAGVLAVNVALAQAPAGSTGQCKDGTYTTAASKKGACRGHKGVQTWFAASAAAPAPMAAMTPKTPAPAASPAPAAAPAPAKAPRQMTAMQQAPGGGAGMVWVNTDSKVYHCAGSKYYGKTKQGKYMSEADAKASGAHADHNHPCMK